MQTKTDETVASDIRSNGEYRIEAVRVKDHALIRIFGKDHTAEVIVALPDSTRYLYLGFTGEHCRVSDLHFVKSQTEVPVNSIPRIAEKISYIDGPDGEIPNVHGGIVIRDTLTVNTAGKKLYAALTGDQVALTDIRIR